MREGAAGGRQDGLVVLELAVEQQDRGNQDDGGNEAEQRPGIIVIAEQRRTIAGVAGHDVQQHLPGRRNRACDRRQQRHRIVAGAGAEADIEDRPDGQRREQDALQQAERAGQFLKDELRREGCRQHQRHGVEAECI